MDDHFFFSHPDSSPEPRPDDWRSKPGGAQPPDGAVAAADGRHPTAEPLLVDALIGFTGLLNKTSIKTFQNWPKWQWHSPYCFKAPQLKFKYVEEKTLENGREWREPSPGLGGRKGGVGEAQVERRDPGQLEAEGEPDPEVRSERPVGVHRLNRAW